MTMNSSPKLTAVKRPLSARFAVVIALALLGEGVSAPARAAQSPAISQEERLLEDVIPKNIPIKIKIKAEQETSFKNLNNEHWLRAARNRITCRFEKR